MIPQKYYDFQDDIKKGMTIQKALTKHNITLKEAFTTLQFQNHNIHKNKNRKKPSWTGQLYITQNNGKYLLRKNMGKKLRYFGRYDTLEEAIQVRDYLMENGWTRASLAQIRKQIKGE